MPKSPNVILVNACVFASHHRPSLSCVAAPDYKPKWRVDSQGYEGSVYNY